MPIENFTKGSAGQFKSVLEKEVKHHRPATAAPKYKSTKMSNLLHGTDNKNERDFLKQQTKYTDQFQSRQQDTYDIGVVNINTEYKANQNDKKIPVLSSKGADNNERLLEQLNRICFREIISIQNKLEADRAVLAE